MIRLRLHKCHGLGLQEARAKVAVRGHGIEAIQAEGIGIADEPGGGPGWNRTSTAFAAVLQTVRLTNAQPTHSRPPQPATGDGYGTRSGESPDCIMAP